MERCRISVVGAAGYAGGEVLRLLSAHPKVTLEMIASETYAGKPLRAAFPGFGNSALAFTKLEISQLIERSDLVVLAQENGFAMEHAARLLEAGKKVVDLSADFRLKDAALYPQWYKSTHLSPALLAEAVYGLPELYRAQIKAAKLLANPGCYPTATVLALAPLLKANLIDPKSIIVDAKSGVSGAGRSKHSLEYHFAEANESVRAYGVGGVHRHTPEIEQELGRLVGAPLTLTFTPHLIPITRGILSTCYGTAMRATSAAELQALFADHYKSEPFVTVLDVGAFPVTKGTYGTNQCHIGVGFDARTNRVVVVSVIDNLVKGAAGQAVQNINLMCGFDESAGLSRAGVWP
ncbi:MAG: N-acetyl-gamma-glutamyl-phosphate reductase [Proteobacteria bacterium]|nr:N-acetyl-gamma-glutamyl-phosphate reductase [Pseudomonadota bacterium]